METTMILTPPGEMDIKRCYMQGELKINCPGCKAELIHDFEKKYLPYPEVGEEIHTAFYCDDCERWFNLKYARITKIEIHIAYDPTIIEED